MLINIIWPGKRTELRSIEIGQNLVGIRILSMVIENKDEMHRLATEAKAQDWLRSISYRAWYPNMDKVLEEVR